MRHHLGPLKGTGLIGGCAKSPKVGEGPGKIVWTAGVVLPYQGPLRLPVPSEALALVPSSSPKLLFSSLLSPPLVVTLSAYY